MGYIHSVGITEFRNIKSLKLQLSPSANVFFGMNGQGKTNFLEAVHYTLRGYSFRTQDNQDLMRKSSEPKEHLSRISMDIHRDRMKTNLQAVILDKKKLIKLNDKPVSGLRLVAEFPLVLFSPDSLAAIKEGPELRRELLNEMVVLDNPQNHRIINDYQKALRARNKFLKATLENPKIDYELLAALSETTFKLAIELIATRLSVIRYLTPVFEKTAQTILSDDSSMVLGYSMSDVDILEYSRAQIEDLLQQRRLELYDAELSSRTTLWGPHKHDLIVTYGGNSARFFCSQGQQRALILALKISQIVHHFESYGKYPILLLDDVFSELDKDLKTLSLRV